MMRLRQLWTSRQDESGSMAPWLLGLIVVLILLAGVGYDLGGHSAAEQQLRVTTDQAARAAGNAIDRAAAARGDGVVVDLGPAVAAAQNTLTAAGVEGTVTVISADTVRIETTGSYHTTLLGAVGVSSLPLHASAEATAVRTLDGRPR